jgi:hypothetical protein
MASLSWPPTPQPAQDQAVALAQAQLSGAGAPSPRRRRLAAAAVRIARGAAPFLRVMGGRPPAVEERVTDKLSHIERSLREAAAAARGGSGGSKR